MIEDYRYTKRDLDQAYKRGYHKSIAEFRKDLDFNEFTTIQEVREKWEQKQKEWL